MTARVNGKEPWQLTATEISPYLRKGELKVEDYVKSLLSRIHQRDSAVRAWVFFSPSLILQRAKELDDLPLDQRGPLFGLPVAVKDVILTKDMPTQYNSRMFQTEEASGVDANCVMSLRQSGALIFGKTSTTEFATSKQGNWHQNLTANARDPKRTPGGSSSGSAAAVADFQVPFALGTQTGGSIVRPASFNGCYGFKPTWGAISREGLAQWSVTLDTCGFFTRSIDDLVVLADAFQIKDDDPVPSKSFSLQGAKIGFCKTPNWPQAGEGTRGAMSKAQDILTKHGATVEEFDLPEDFDKVLGWHAAVMAGEGRTSFLGQYLTHKDLMHETIVGHVDNVENVSRKAQLQAYDGCARLRPILDEIASKYDAVITPSVIDEAPVGLENTGDMVSRSPRHRSPRHTATLCPVC